jgi:nucleotide-binding universal stress UspA family protein
MMYKTILVPLDGSKRAEVILPHVEELTRRFQAKVILLQVLEAPWVAAGPEGTYFEYQANLDQREKKARDYLDALQSAFREKGIEVEIQLDSAPVVDAIIKTADDREADLIAMASHGRSGLSRVFYGSVAAGVLQRVDRPLLLIRSGLEEEAEG